MPKKIKYTFKPEFGNFTEKDLTDKRNQGLCDALIIHSIAYENGAREEMIFSRDGELGKELSPHDLFKSWIMMAKMLSEMLPDDLRKDLTTYVFGVNRQVIMSALDKIGKLPSTMERLPCGDCNHVDYVPSHECRINGKSL